jgi:maltose O-acetyltransferase
MNIKKIIKTIFQKFRIFFYYSLSENKIMKNGAKYYQPVLGSGLGDIKLGQKCGIGVETSPGFYSDYAYLEARKSGSSISIGENTKINNCVKIIANSSEISIGRDCLIGFNVSFYDSDFHGISIETRRGTTISKPIFVGDNVFIGSNVTILKGVSIGNNSVIAAGSIIVTDIPKNVVFGGFPAKKIRAL